MLPTIAIIGASTQRHKYGNRAVRAYASRGWKVFPIHPTAARIEGHRAVPSITQVPVAELDRVSIYLPPEIGLKVIETVAARKVREVWLNPGAESAELIARANELGLKVIAACSIVAIGVHPGTL